MDAQHTLHSSAAGETSDDAYDPVFAQGLQSILGPLYARGASEEEIQEVTRRAYTFYSQSKPSPAATTAPLPSPPSPLPSSAALPSQSAPTASSAEQPPYPLSFAALASLIASGAPIPGIREIPDKLAEGVPSESRVDVGRVRKPWEVETKVEEVAVMEE